MSVNPAIEQLCRLCRFGFNGQRLFNHDGDLDLVHYTREFQGLREVVLVYSEREALAYRTHDLLDPNSPLHSTENAVEWRLYGDVVTVVNALLSLPTPEPAESPTQAVATTTDTAEVHPPEDANHHHHEEVTMPATPARPTRHRWRDVNGTHIPLLCRVEQIVVHQAHGALLSRLHQRGQVIGRSQHWLTVRFDDHQLISLRPHHVRVLDEPGGC